jgi:hypothetical protein
MQPRARAPRAACRARAPHSLRLRLRQPPAPRHTWAACRTATTDDGALLLGAMPLVGFEPAVALAGRLLPGLADAGRLHAFLLLRRADAAAGGAQAAEGGDAHILDFLPVDPKSPATAARLLSGGSVTGSARVRPLSAAAVARLGATLQPAGGCDVRAVLSAAAAFNAAWGTSLSLAGGRNCADYRAALLLKLRADGLVRPPE